MVTQITQLPPAPSRQRPSEFSNEADAFVGQLPTFGNQANQLALEVNALATQVQSNTNTAVQASSSATSAKNEAVAAKDTAVASANTATSAATTATAGANTATVQADRAQDLVDSISNITTGPVIAFNNRAGAVTLQSGDVTAALGFHPVKPYVVLPAGTDLNGVVVSGFYRLNLPTNGPGSLADYGQLIVSEGNGTIFQVASSHNNGFSFCRQGYISGSSWVFTRWVPLGKKPVLYITDNDGHMHGGNGESALNAVNVWVYGAHPPGKYIPANPMLGDECTIVMANGRTDSQLSPAPSGEPIMGLNEIMTIDRTNVTVTFVYVGGTYGWRIM